MRDNVCEVREKFIEDHESITYARGRYLLFVYCRFYPDGGGHDFTDRSDNLDYLRGIYKDTFQKLYESYYDIFDLNINKTIETNYSG